jgi:Icc-related predicted phosphoesterase
MAAVCIIGLRIESAKLPDFFGNQEDKLAKMAEVKPDYFTFVAMGDIKGGTATFRELLSIAGQDKPAFGVILGDVVDDPWHICHKLLARKVKQTNVTFPLFMVVGNHDTDPNGPFRLSDYEQMYGASQFHFTIGKYLFIFLNDAPPYDATGEYLQFLEQTLSQHRKPDSVVFVFMHVAPSDLNGTVKTVGAKGSQQFMDLAKKFKIDYVLCGDHHGYVKGVIDETTYIITGGGGDRLRGEHGRFHHLTRIAINHGQVTETVIATQKKDETIYLLERNVVNYVWPLMRRSALTITLTAVIAVAFVSLTCFGIRGSLRLRRSEAERKMTLAG